MSAQVDDNQVTEQIEEGEMDEVVEGDMEENPEEDEGPAPEFVKKEYVARPYVSEFGTEKDIENEKVHNSRTLIRMRVTKPRKDFADDSFSFTEKDAGDTTNDLKQNVKGATQPFGIKRKELDIGLQAANKMVNLQTQTYFNRSVNAMCQYEPNDFIKEIQKSIDEDKNIGAKLDKFVDRVAKRVEEALQSNEIINVFQSDFEKLGDDEAASGSQTQSGNQVARAFFDQTYCKNKSVTCIKFHPTKQHLVAMSVVENLTFDERIEASGKSYDSHVLVLNFADSQVIYPNYALQTPVEISCIEFSPDSPSLIIGGCINGQLIAWDTRSTESRITDGRKVEKKAEAVNDDNEEDEKTQQAATKMKEIAMSLIERSHKSFVSDIKFIPKDIRVDRKRANEGKHVHCITCADDGVFNIWDIRNIDLAELEMLRDRKKSTAWVPFLTINVFRTDGSGDMGFSKILFEANQTTNTFWAASDEGELAQIDWTVRPEKSPEGNDLKPAEFIQREYASERSTRPVVALEQSPFYEDLMMTVHDFHFAIWKTSLADREEPIFRSANTFGSHNTCGSFSPTRAGVIFISKTNGIDIWDFFDQSDKPSIQLSIATSAITFFRLHTIKQGKKETQLMAYGDESEGTLYMQEVSANLRQPQVAGNKNEEQIIKNFWDNEVVKCDFVTKRRVQLKEEWNEIERREQLERAKAEAKEEQAEELEQQQEELEEMKYQDLLLTQKALLGLISAEELEREQEARKKGKR